MSDLRFWPILDHIMPGMRGFAILADNCQESFELLARENYVSFGDYHVSETHFVTNSGFHCFNFQGEYVCGWIDSDIGIRHVNNEKFQVFTLEDFLDICDGADETFADIALEDVIGA